MLRVIHICAEKPWRGGEQQLAWLIEESDKLGVENFIAVKKDSAFEVYCTKNNIGHRAFSFSSQLDFRSALKLKRYCREVRADIIYCHSSMAHAITMLATELGNRVPVIVSRKVDFPISRNFLSTFKYNHSIIRKIICVSEEVRAVISAQIKKPEKCTVVYDGIDPDRFFKGDNENILRTEYNIKEDEWLIGIVAALAPHKDHFTFIKCASIVSKKIKARFIIIGEGELKEELIKYAQQLNIADKIIFTGFRADLGHVFHELDLFLFTSETEGLGSSILDAMVCKVPVVSTNAGGIPEIVKDGFNGLLAPVKDAEGLAEKVLTLFNDKSLRTKLVANASDFVLNFTKDKMARKTVEVYNEIIDKANG